MPRYDRYDIIPVVVLIVVAVLAVIAVGIWLDNSSRSYYASAQPAFDHSVCQYPARLTNPPDGCDNTDPARPECMKSGLEDCDILKDDTTPILNVEAAPAPSPAVKISNCKE